ncbi:PAS domain S-box protein [candidate division WOR-3 bacterium]|uniref:histidine kinase n=1 Tax=candidate division WOR-3 bacterium TaxID=2052148 RepID=A0A9D5QC12_UNCW3|nr:PAS domain S-box protein [candidate division WOR-3 bacterium]MBD3364183.1 PAS domain S-box protein [candidate division WOR-3 bacterium]
MNSQERTGGGEALENTTDLYRSLHDNIPVGVFRTTPEGNFLSLNKALVHMYGYSSPDEMKGLSVYQLYSCPEQREELLKQALKKGEISNFEVQQRRKDGSDFWVSLNLKVVKDKGKEVQYYDGIVQDISERKQVELGLQESNERYRTLFENSPVSLWVEDRSGIKKYIDGLKAEGIEDIRGFFSENPEEVKRCFSLSRVMDVNKAAVKLYGAGSKQDLIKNVNRIFTDEVYELIKDELISISEGKTVFTGEGINQTFTGDKIYISLKMSVAPGHEETFDRILVSIIDITERRKAVKALRREKGFTDSILNTAKDTVFVFDPETGKPLRWNKAFREKSGYTDEEISSMKAPDDWYDEEDLKRAAETARTVFELGHGTVEISLIKKDGSKIPTEYAGSLVKDNRGKPKYIISVGRDVTERKKAEDALKESEEKYRNLVERANDGITIVQDAKIMYMNPSLVKMMGYSADEVIGKPFAAHIDPGELAKVEDYYRRRMTGEQVPSIYETVILHKDGTRIYVEMNVGLVSYGGRPAEFVFVRNITERKKAEQNLKESHERFLTVLDSLDSGVYVADMNTYEILYANRRMCKYFGEIIGKTCWKVLQKNQNGPCTFCTNDKLLDSKGEPTGVYSWEFKNPISGFWCEIRDRAIRWVDGRMVRLEIAMDINERKQTEDALVDSEERFRHLAENFKEALIIYDGSVKKTIYANPGSENLFGIPREEILELDTMGFIDRLVHPEDREKAKKEAHKLWETRLAGGSERRDFEYRILRPDGEVRWCRQSSFQEVKEGKLGSRGYLIVADITERRLSRERIRKHAEDLALVYDLNNAVNRGASFREITRFLIERMLDIFEGRGGNVSLLSEDGKYLIIQDLLLPPEANSKLKGIIGKYVIGQRFPYGKGSFYAAVIEQGCPQIINDPDMILESVRKTAELTGDEDFIKKAPEIVKLLGMNATIDVPLLSEHEVTGVLSISRRVPFTVDDLARVEFISKQLTTILERRRAEEREAEYLHDLAILSQTAMDFVQLEPEQDIYRYVCDKLKELAGEVIVYTAGYDEERNECRIRALSGLGKFRERVLKILGQQPEGYRFTVPSESKKHLLSGELKGFEFDPELLTEWNVPKSITAASKKLLGLNKLYSVGFVKDTKLLGQAVIVPFKDNGLRNKEIVEAFIHQASVALQRRQAESSLAESEAKFRGLAESVKDVIFSLDLDGTILYMSPVASNMLGVKAADYIGKNILESDLFSKHNRKLFTEKMDPKGHIPLFEMTLKDVEGKNHIVEISAMRFPKQIIGSIRDITERKRMEQELHRAGKLASLGVLVGGLAHQLNNPLAVMMSASAVLSRALSKLPELPDGITDDVYDPLETIERQVKRVTKIVSGLLAFAQEKDSEVRPANINLLVSKTLQMFMQSTPAGGIKIDLQLTDNLPKALIDPEALEQVLLNLVRNAVEAMDGKGTVTIETESSKEDTLRLKVSDTGPGIPEEMREEIFNPLFTTKTRGTGLGLSLSVMLLEHFGGRIWIGEGDGKVGVTFVVEVPVSGEEADE